jgi:tryprostatin B 6-hydroxylase
MLRLKLRDALAPVYEQSNGEVRHSALAQVKYLNALINETLRMNNSVTTGGPRITPEEGLRVGDIYIPGTVNFITPHHIIHRSKALYSS